jgi:acid phosphatase (class A)
VLGPWFARASLPLTTAFMKNVDEDRREVTEVATKLFARARPWVVDARVQPGEGKPGNDSSPCGHTSSIFTRAGLLAESFPEKRTELGEFAHRAVWEGVYAGVHFPSDVVGGWMLAEPIVQELKTKTAFRAQVEKGRAAMKAFVAKPAP